VTATLERLGQRGGTFLQRSVRIGKHDVPMAYAAPFVIGVLIRVAFAWTDNVVGPDESAYIGTGLNIWRGKGIVYRGQPQLHFPPLLPAILGGLAKVLPEPHHATVLVTFVTSIVLMVILAALASRIAGRSAAALTLWIVALSPGLSATLARNAGGSEAISAAVMFGAALLTIGTGKWDDRPTVVRAFVVGLMVGAGYLLRPENLPLAAVFGLVLALRAVGGRVTRATISADNVRRVLALAVAMFVGVMIFAFPYLAYLHSHSGKWELTAKSVDVNIEAWQALAHADRRTRDIYIYALDKTGHSTTKPEYPLTQLAKEHPKEYLGIVGTNLLKLYKALISFNTTTIKGWRLFALPLLPFALYGMWRYRSRSASVVTTALIGLTLATVIGFFVLDRYLPPVVAGFAVFAGVGLATLQSQRRNLWIALGIAGSILSLLTYLTDPIGPTLVRERKDIQLAARWLRPQAKPGDVVMTRGTSLPYYMPEQRLVVPPVGSVNQTWRYARFNHVKYFVFEPTTQLWRPQLALLTDGADHSNVGFKLLHRFVQDGRPTFIYEIVEGGQRR
jgi:hypothetical protein